MSNLTIVIQAGGESRRMGRPKALVPLCGTPLICRGLKRLGLIADELIVTSNDQKSLDFLCSKVTFENKLKLYSDVLDVRGALTGLHTALHYATEEYVGIVACDMIFPSPTLLLAEQQALIETGADAAVPRTSHGFEPFHAVYRRETCLPLVEAAIAAGRTKATSWYCSAKLVDFTSDMIKNIDERGGAFINVNTPDELEAMEIRILTGDQKDPCGREK